MSHNYFVEALEETDQHDDNSKCHRSHSQKRLPAPRTQLDITQWRQDISQRARTRSSNQLENLSQVASYQAHSHGAKYQRRCKDEMATSTERRLGVVVILHDLSADKSLERKSCEHVEAEAETSNVDHEIVAGKVVEDIALCLIFESKESSQGHDQTKDHRDAGGEVGDAGKTVEGRFAEGAVDEKGVVVADKSCDSVSSEAFPLQEASYQKI